MIVLGRFFFVYSQSTTRWSQAFRPSVRPGRQWRDSNPRQTDPCRSQGGLTSHCATDAQVLSEMTEDLHVAIKSALEKYRHGLEVSNFTAAVCIMFARNYNNEHNTNVNDVRAGKRTNTVCFKVLLSI
ncbi:hypothetical protein PoB_006216200 [Plakobranchus ocellatus]|uniref:Uncharacterized protein n=1 Tax=Plakobranchus ocellatus TaxID=259542 RepID=A0AAV4CUS2_9GAST|nr:hypothetical protein PoB_006216200 [Plakobranchus ocellatus]